MDLRRRPSRALYCALGVSLVAHAILGGFVRVPATAAPAPQQRPTIVEMLPFPTPRPLGRPTPRPVVVRPRAIPIRPHVAAHAPSRPHVSNVTRASRATRASASIGAGTSVVAGPGVPGDGDGVAQAETSAAPSRAEPEVEATPLTTPVPVASACPGEARDASVVEAVTPDRPPLAEEQGAVGRVVVEVRLARDGSVERASVHASSGFASLDAAAVDAAAHARYAPASDGCGPVAGTYLYVVDFTE